MTAVCRMIGAKGKAKALVFLWLALVSPVFGQSEIQHTFVLNEPPRPCNGQHYAAWRANPYGRTVYIVGGYGWQGASRDIRADIGYALYRVNADNTGHTLIADRMWDHYAEPTRAEDHITTWRIEDDYLVWEPSQVLLWHYGCTMIGPQNGPWIEYAPNYWVHPYDYYMNVIGHHQQARLYVTFDRPRRDDDDTR